MNLLFSYLVFYLGKIYVYVFTKIPENLYLCESAEVFLYSEIETKKSFLKWPGRHSFFNAFFYLY